MGMVDKEELPSKLRKVSSGDEKEGTMSLSAEIHPNLNGIINLDYSTWKDLKPEHRGFVWEYNESARHPDRKEPTLPSNVTIKEKQDDTKGNAKVP